MIVRCTMCGTELHLEARKHPYCTTCNQKLKGSKKPSDVS